MPSIGLQELQSSCRRDPDSYRTEFLTQYGQFQALVASTELRPSMESKQLENLSSFMAHVSSAYPIEGRKAADHHIRLLKEYGASMHHDLRRSLVKSTTIMYRKDAISIESMVPVLFQLLSVRDKELRKSISASIISSLQHANKKHRNEAVVKSLQKFMYKTIEGSDVALVKRSVGLSIELFRRQIWCDEKTANVIGSAVFHPSPEVMIIAARFVLDSEQKPRGDGGENEDEGESDDESDDDTGDGGSSKRAKEMWKSYNLTGKKNARKSARVQKAMKKMMKKKRKPSSGSAGAMKANPFSAIMLINNPQEYTERLFSDLQTRKKNVSFDAKLTMINLITRMISIHELLVLNLYPLLQRYLQPHQERVTVILAYLAQACHSLVPPDAVQPMVKTIADTFVTDRCSEETIAVGLNSIREICARVPLAIEDESVAESDVEGRAALLRDLAAYKSHRDKGVSMAARSLIQLYREINPALLVKKDRGRGNTPGSVSTPKYGAVDVQETIEGVNLLKEEDSGEEEELNVDGAEEVVDNGDYDSLENEGSPDDDDAEGIANEEDISDEPEEIAHVANVSGAVPKSLAMERILGDADFQAIKEKLAENDLAAVFQSKRPRPEEVIDVGDIETYKKKARRTLEERLESVRAGREGREKFGSAKGRKAKGGGSSNKQKDKRKQGAMVLHKVRRKARSKGGKQPRKKRR
ncbi:hypothetical protein NDN08_000485 [Rhodosorus marinus]|uniref:Protein SDA1 n=1 Tax=Rhodosorus marinus TaxID=101924 RepID=A0AAV8UPL0_9RHOD|nr:hypothetical protein NDN08_000485 [Rhodosorus marinus]